jgi:hypothetical protein
MNFEKLDIEAIMAGGPAEWLESQEFQSLNTSQLTTIHNKIEEKERRVRLLVRNGGSFALKQGLAALREAVLKRRDFVERSYTTRE